MKAAVIHEFGDVDVLKYEDVPTPTPKPGHILIKVLAAGVNRLDHNLREGSIVPELPFPHILGIDAAGEVAELGPGVSGFQIGERVVPMLGLGIWGTYAEYIEVPARWVLKDDTGLKPEELATLPMVLATGVRAVKVVGGVKAGDKVLVQAGASGSGSLQIQIAKALGAQVATTVRDDAKGEFAKSLGADLVINTRKEVFVQRVKEWTGGQGADVVIDNLGGDVLSKSIDAARAQGVIVAFGFTAGTEVTFDIRFDHLCDHIAPTSRWRTVPAWCGTAKRCQQRNRQKN